MFLVEQSIVVLEIFLIKIICFNVLQCVMFFASLLKFSELAEPQKVNFFHQ